MLMSQDNQVVVRRITSLAEFNEAIKACSKVFTSVPCWERDAAKLTYDEAVELFSLLLQASI